MRTRSFARASEQIKVSDTFHSGDVVTLKSGGPNMTVDHVNEDGSIMCMWFDDNNNLQSASLKTDMLDSNNMDEMFNALNRFAFCFQLVFDADWEMTRGCIDESDDFINGTFINPMVDDESNNWANRGALLESWRRLLICMERLDVLEESPF